MTPHQQHEIRNGVVSAWAITGRLIGCNGICPAILRDLLQLREQLIRIGTAAQPDLRKDME